LTEGITNLIF